MNILLWIDRHIPWLVLLLLWLVLNVLKLVLHVFWPVLHVLCQPPGCMQQNFWKSMYTLPSGSVKIYTTSVKGESLTLALFHCTSCTTTCNIFLPFAYILLNTSFPAHCLITIVLPYDLLNILFFPATCYFSRTLTIFACYWYSSCSLPYCCWKITFHNTYNISLPLLIFHRNNYISCNLSCFLVTCDDSENLNVFSQLLCFLFRWVLLNIELLLPNVKFGCTLYLFNLFYFFLLVFIFTFVFIYY